jgi:hypothetical protein
MRKELRTIICLALVAVVCQSVTGSSEEVFIKRNPFDRQPYFEYLFNAKDSSRVFFSDGGTLAFRFKKGNAESTFELPNPVFIIRGDFMAGYRYASVGNELFATYRIIESTTGEKVTRSYVYRITGLDNVTTPTIKNLGLFYRENTWFLQVVAIDEYFIALTYDFIAHSKMIEVYDKYKRCVAQYPAIEQSISLCYSQSENTLYFVDPQGLLTELSMDTLRATAYSFEEPAPDLDSEDIKKPALPLLSIFPKDREFHHLYYLIAKNFKKALLFDADLSTQKVRLVAELDGAYIGEASAFDERFIYVWFTSVPEGDTRWFLYDTIEKKFIPLRGSFHPYPHWCITLERPRATPYLVEKVGNDYNFEFLDNFAFDDNSIALIRK